MRFAFVLALCAADDHISFAPSSDERGSLLYSKQDGRTHASFSPLVMSRVLLFLTLFRIIVLLTPEGAPPAFNRQLRVCGC